jgi:hypothetical protein
MLSIAVEPIGFVSCTRSEAVDDARDSATTSIQLTDAWSR